MRLCQAKLLKSLFRIVALLALMWLVQPALTSQAAGECFPGMSAADCRLMEEAGANLSRLSTFVMDHSTILTAAGLTGGNFDFSAAGNGPVDLSKIRGTSLSLALQNLAFSTTLRVRLTQGKNSQTSIIELRALEGTLFLRDNQKPWVSLLLEELQQSLQLNDVSIQGTDFDLGNALRRAKLDVIPNFIRGEGRNGPTIDGQATRQLTVHFSIPALFKFAFGPQLRPLLKNLLQQQGYRLSDSEITQAATLLQSMFKDTTFAMSWFIGKADKTYRRFAIDYVSKFDSTNSAILQGRRTASPMTLSLKFQVTVSKIGQPVRIGAVTNAVDVTDIVKEALKRQLPALPQPPRRSA
jgi:hypothetical protein